MSKRLVDIDDELLEEASVVLGAATMKEAVNRSLESVVLAARRRRHGERLETMEGLDLDNPEIMAGAWRWTHGTWLTRAPSLVSHYRPSGRGFGP